MDPVFCCSQITPFKARRIDREEKFRSFIDWAKSLSEVSSNPAESTPEISWDSTSTYVIQATRQINYGALEWRRYFVTVTKLGGTSTFHEVKEQDIIDANYTKVNSFKNFRCDDHNKFFEINMYQKDPVNTHHWRANIARPGREIDL